NVLQLVSTAPYLITATHTSPTTKKVSDLQFLLEQSTVCKMTVSAFFFSDHDNEYLCSSLCTGSDLISAEGYKQFSNKWICPGFDTANCTLSSLI
uniref:Uncharacterized protein n=1 Tax=Dicentrarchus labrax TaxID=13489 RepID=A0A8C4GDY0_DICLA